MGRLGSAVLLGLIVVAGLLDIASPAIAEVRLALVISNASYPAEIGRLENPHKDSAIIAAALESVGFEKRDITVLRDADQPTMRLAVADFIERIEKAGSDAVVFLYYSGHGAADRTERGENYLIPAGAKITLAKQLPILGVSLSEITKSLERVSAKARFVVVDACRNVAFTKGLKDAAKGFVPERKLDGMILAFATRPGETAGDNNIYATALASILPTPGLRAEEVFKETQLKVAELSKGTQIPWTEDGLLAKFKFKEGAPQTEVEFAFWSAAKERGTIGSLESYLQRYPDGVHAGAAKTLIEQMRQEQASRAAMEVRESELRKAEEANRLAQTREEQERRRADEAKRAHELARAREELRRTQEAVRKAEAERVAALEAADQARRGAEAARASVTKATAELQTQTIASFPQGTDAKLSQDPSSDRADLARSIQAELKRVGCDPGSVDGRWGARAMDALRAFNRAAMASLSVDAPTENALREIAVRKGRICALTCAPHEKVQDGRCVAIVESKGTRPKEKEEPPRATRQELGGKKTGNCWWQGGGPTFRIQPCTGAPGERPAN
jgi:hypothetical protein